MLEVGGEWPGLYTVVGTYNGRGDYYSENVTYNIFFVFEEASSEEGSGDDDDDENSRRRRSLQGDKNPSTLVYCSIIQLVLR